MNRRNGWDFLNSEDDDFFSDEDGSWGYKNEDGSGYYSGSDGSWGYKNADGSSYYSGEDGSWGYKEADGSGFYDDGDNSHFYNPVDDEENDNAEESSLSGSLAKLALALGGVAIVGIANRRARKREEKKNGFQNFRPKEEHQEKEEPANNQNSVTHNNKVQLQFSTQDIIGRDCIEIKDVLSDLGFSNIRCFPVKDNLAKSMSLGEILHIFINGNSQFDRGIIVPIDAEIIIMYYMNR